MDTLNISHEKTPQFKMLTEVRARKTKDGVFVNPFFGKTRSDVVADMEYAKEIYKDVFNLFSIAWCRTHESQPPYEWRELVL